MAQLLANKYRPRSLDEVVGQAEAKEVIKSILAKGVPSGAYLFSGTSGSGKTTCARIVAESVGENGRLFTEICEVNASADNGIEGTRVLKDTLSKQRFANARMCVILDEAHMYTTAAWASLLKTIEEPDNNSAIIFCTTDPQKMPRTITSRCIQVQFNPVSTDEIVDRLITVIKAERETGNEIQATKKGLILIAQGSRGSVRRALFSLEECCGDATLESVKRLPGIVSYAKQDHVLKELLGATPPTLFDVGECLIEFYNNCGEDATQEVLTAAIEQGCFERSLSPEIIEKYLDARVLMTKIPAIAAIRGAFYVAYV